MNFYFTIDFFISDAIARFDRFTMFKVEDLDECISVTILFFLIILLLYMFPLSWYYFFYLLSKINFDKILWMCWQAFIWFVWFVFKLCGVDLNLSNIHIYFLIFLHVLFFYIGLIPIAVYVRNTIFDFEDWDLWEYPPFQGLGIIIIFFIYVYKFWYNHLNLSTFKLMFLMLVFFQTFFS